MIEVENPNAERPRERMNLHRLTGIILHMGTGVSSWACFVGAGYKVHNGRAWEVVFLVVCGTILGTFSWKVGYHRGRFDGLRDKWS